jgi:PhnB protein
VAVWRMLGTIFLYVPDVDAVFAKAKATGATPHAEPTDMFWGDRFGSRRDPFGHEWSIATHVEDVTPEEMQRPAAGLS